MSRLETDANLWLATTRPDGRPHLAPVWFVAVDGDLWVGTGADSVKVRNLDADARATVALEDGDAPVVAEVTAELVARPFPPPVVGAFAAKYGWDLRVEVDDDLGPVVLLRLRPVRWVMGGPDA